MTENAELPATGLNLRFILRRVVYPLAVIIAIAAVIWWLEARDDAARSPVTGEEYGVRQLPQGLAPPGARVAAEEGSLAPDFLLEVVGGGEARLSDYRGRPVVLNFWATWCRPCRKEMPQFVEAYDRYRGEGLVIIGVNLQQGAGVIQPFADEYGIEFPLLIDRDGEVGDRYRLLGLPSTFFIDRQGVIRSVYTGPLEGEQQGTNVAGAIEAGELDSHIQEILRG